MGKPVEWWSPEFGAAEIQAAAAVIRSGYVNDGEVAERFAARAARVVGARHGVAVTSGTAALFCGLRAAGIGPGDEVIVPDVGFVAAANAVHLTGAKVVLADVEPETLGLAPAAVRRLVGPRTKALLVVHVSGRSANLAELNELAHQHDLALIEDACEAFGSKGPTGPLGAQGIVGAFSFTANKTVSTGQGGLVVTNDGDVATRLRELKDQGRPRRGTGGDDIHPSIGYNFKFTDIQAAIGLAQLSRFPARRRRLRRHFQIYKRGLRDVPDVSLVDFRLDVGEVPQWVDALVPRRQALEQHLSRWRIGFRRFWHPIHRQVGYRRPDHAFPVSNRIAAQGLWLPSSFKLTDRDIDRVVASIRECFPGPERGRRKGARKTA